jgi:MoaA/NifB/PqqE/SkfB family radical SAM enzyme
MPPNQAGNNIALFLRSIPRKIEKVVHFFCLTRYRPSLKAPLPTHIEVEATKRCNATCGTCTRSHLDREDMKNDLHPDTLAKVLTTLPGLTSLRLAGLGEIFLNPQIENILQQLKARSIRVWIITNGSLLLDEKVRNLIHDYVDDVAVSIDSTDPAEFARLRPMGNVGLAEVAAGLKLLISERNAGRSNATIGISTTVTHENYLDLPAIGTMSIGLGIDYVAIAFVENWMIPGDPGYSQTSDTVNESMQFLPQIRTAIRRQQIRLAMHGVPVGCKIPRRRIGKCYWPYRSIHITAEGLASPCCTRIRPNHALFNFLATQDFEAEWNGPAYQELRLAHMRKDTLNPMCGNCPL